MLVCIYYNWLPVLGWMDASTITGYLRVAGCTYYHRLPVGRSELFDGHDTHEDEFLVQVCFKLCLVTITSVGKVYIG